MGLLLCGLLAIGARGDQDVVATENDSNLKRVESSIDRALVYLASRQLKDGSFSCPRMPGNTAVTSLCVMSFLARGYTPGTGPYGRVIDKGIDYILSQQQKNGLIVCNRGKSHGPMYSHGTSTLLLSEVSGMVSPRRQEKIDHVLSRALRLILSAQKVAKKGVHRGGWRYSPASRSSDISCSSWALMSLRSARNNGSAVPVEAIDMGVAYILALRCKDGGFGYSSPKSPALARTGTALLCLELCGKHGHEATIAAGEWILKHMPKRFGGGNFYYGLYYCSQGMFQLGGKYWKLWAPYMQTMMLKFQQKNGSWPTATGGAAKAGPCYSTAMSVLAMTVSYRQLPIYQR